jgi:hypothetical protein
VFSTFLGTEKPMLDKKQINNPQRLTNLNYERIMQLLQHKWPEIEKRLSSCGHMLKSISGSPE